MSTQLYTETARQVKHVSIFTRDRGSERTYRGDDTPEIRAVKVAPANHFPSRDESNSHNRHSYRILRPHLNGKRGHRHGVVGGGAAGQPPLLA